MFKSAFEAQILPSQYSELTLPQQVWLSKGASKLRPGVRNMSEEINSFGNALAEAKRIRAEKDKAKTAT